MVILTVFKRNIKIVYKTTLVSKASVLILIFGIFTVALPFVFAYKSRGFWLKRDIFYEQPDVRFKGEYLFVATTTNLSHPVACVSTPQFTQVPEYLDKCATIKVQEVDSNFDNKIDQLVLKLQVNLPDNTHITSISIAIPLDYKLHTVCAVHMQSVLLYQSFLPLALSEYSIFGDLALWQSSALKCPRNQINTQYNYSVFSKGEDANGIDAIIDEMSHRNFSTKLKNMYTTFKTGHTDNFVLNLIVHYPEHQIYYRPDFWQILKWAWIQYLAMYTILSWIVHQIKLYIFSKRLVLFYEDNPLKKNQ